MLIPFNALEGSSKVWIFGSNRPFSTQEEENIRTQITHFISQWQDDGKPITASFDIRSGQFIVVATNGTTYVDGCALDELLRLVKEFETRLGLSLLVRTNIYLKNESSLKILTLTELKNALQNQEISPQQTVINTTVSTLDEYLQKWEVPLQATYLKRYLQN